MFLVEYSGIGLRMTKRFKAKVRKAAEAEDRTLSKYIFIAIKEKLERDGGE